MTTQPLQWVTSMGGPLLVVPISGVRLWNGRRTNDDYGRACAVSDDAGLIAIGERGAQALVLGSGFAPTCYLREYRCFLRWHSADDVVELVSDAETALADDSPSWTNRGIWETDGPAVLMDAADSGTQLHTGYTDGTFPEQAPIPLDRGRWTIRTAHIESDTYDMGLIQLLPSP